MTNGLFNVTPFFGREFDHDNENTVSVVIPTLGGGMLDNVIDSINLGSIKPDEILLVVPDEDAHKVSSINIQNVKIVISKIRGQVSQRALGFKVAKGDYVLQLDDDIILDNLCLEKLLTVLRNSNHRTAVGPSLIDIKSNNTIYKTPDFKSFFFRIYCFIVNRGVNVTQGIVDMAGTAMGFKGLDVHSNVIVEWLPGGCILHRKSNLIFDNYYPFSGKAYYEDIIHSYLLQKSGVTLIVVTDAICKLESNDSNKITIKQFLNDLFGDLRARKYYMDMVGMRFWRAYIFYCLALLGFIIRKILS